MFGRNKETRAGSIQEAGDWPNAAPQGQGGDMIPGMDDNGDMDPNSGVKRGLKNRHLAMMALAGIIGPGLLIGAGGALVSGGPASLLIGFGVIGIVVSSRTVCLANH